MKRLISFIILSIFIASVICAQNSNGVGINTTNPQNVFHIDPLGNTNNSTGTEDDIIVGPNGMGIGKTDPAKNLDISGNALFTGTDTICGTVNTNNIIVNDTLRIGADSLNVLYSKLDIVAKNPREGFRFDNGSQAYNDKPHLSDMIPVLTLKNDTMSWVNLDAITKIKSQNLLMDVHISRSNGAGVDVTEGSLTLNKGYWLICAGLATCIANKSDESGFPKQGWYVYLSLRKYPYDSSITMNGAPSEKTGAAVATPQLVYLLHVKEEAEYKIYASTSLGGNQSRRYTTSTRFGNPYFYAIKIE